MRQPLVAGNWKMNGSRASIAELLAGLKSGIGQVTTAEVAVCAPAIYLPDTQAQLDGSPIKWGRSGCLVTGLGRLHRRDCRLDAE